MFLRVLAGLLAFSVLVSCKCQQTASVSSIRDLVGSARTIDQSTVKMQGHEKFVMINFWASWCGPCIQETPSLLHLANENSGKVILLLISEDSSLKDLRSFIKLYPLAQSANVFVIYDEDRRFAQGLGVSSLPRTFVFNREFQMTENYSGAVDWNTPEARQFLGVSR